MTETIRPSCSTPGVRKWHWHSVQRDLVDQGKLRPEDVAIDSLSVNDFGLGGTYRGTPFYVSWVPDMLLMVSSPAPVPNVIEAFSRVVEYQPFAQYRESDTGFYTVEWAKHDAQERFQFLQREGKRDLTQIVEG